MSTSMAGVGGICNSVLVILPSRLDSLCCAAVLFTSVVTLRNCLPAMPRYVAFLRGVSPMNAKMPELKRAFESAGFTNVKTVLSSGNVVFDSRSKSDSALARQADKAMTEQLDRSFSTFVRPVSALSELIEADPLRVAVR